MRSGTVRPQQCWLAMTKPEMPCSTGGLSSSGPKAWVDAGPDAHGCACRLHDHPASESWPFGIWIAALSGSSRCAISQS